MSRERQGLNLDELDAFQPRPRSSQSTETERKIVDRASQFPSREARPEAQMNIRAPAEVLERFRTLAKSDRYTLGAFLEILMDAYEEKQSR